MLKKLLVVAASAAVLALISLCAAFVVGGPEIRKSMKNGNFVWISGETYDGPVSTKELTFDGTKDLTIKMPVEFRFERSETVSMTIEGPRDAIDDLVYENGTLDLEGSGYRLGDGLKVTVTAPVMPGMRLNAPGDIDLVGLDQEAFEFHSAGAADVKASGKVGSLVLVASGAADLDFEDVISTDARIEINGAGDVDISPSGNVEVEINGAGSVSLHTKPAKVTSEINGVGSVDRSY